MHKNSRRGKWFLTFVGLILILLALVTSLIIVFGTETSAHVSVRRFGGAIDGAPANARYEWSLDYSFTASDGKSYNGTATRRGSDTSVKFTPRVKYLSSLPRFNVLVDTSPYGIGQVLYLIMGWLLIYLPRAPKTGRKKEENRQKN